MSLTGHEHRRRAERRRPQLGLVPGRLPAHDHASPTATGGTQPTSTFTPDQFKGKFATAPASDQGLCNAVHPVGAAVGGTGGTVAGPDELRQQGRLHPAPRAVPVLRVDGQPAPPRRRRRCRRSAPTRRPSTGGVPQFDTANHQYDTSDFDSLVGAISHGYLSPDHLPAVSFLKAPGLPGRPRRLLRPDRRAAVRRRRDQRAASTPRTGRAPRSSSPTTTPTAGTTTCTAASTTRRTPRRSPTPPGPQDFLTGTGLCGDTAAQPAARRPERPLRLRSAPAAARHLAVGQAATSSITR